MNSILSVLVAYNQLLIFQIYQLLIFIAKNIPLKAPKYDINSPEYMKHSVDKIPVIKTFKKFNYKKLLKNHQSTYGKELEPVKPRGKNPVPDGVYCPRCNAPHLYLYDNAGGRGQIWCKVCDLHFSKSPKVLFQGIFFTFQGAVLPVNAIIHFFIG